MTKTRSFPTALPTALLLSMALFGFGANAWAAKPSKKIMIVILENGNYEQAMKQPGLSHLAEKGALLNNFHGEAHPSQPNYIALTSGDPHGVDNNNTVTLDVPHIGNLLEAKGRSWKAYLEDYPGNCFTGESKKEYVRKHSPFISYSNVQNTLERCARLVPAEQLAKDIQSGNLPDFSLYIPNKKNNGHDTSASYASRWVTEQLLPTLNRPLQENLTLVVTYDESETYGGDNHIYTVFYGAGVKAGTHSDVRYDHYSLLRTIEKKFDLGTLGLNDAKAQEITDVWR